MSSILEDFFNVKPWEVKAPLPVLNVVQYVAVHNDDHEPVTIIQPNIEKGPWIAGGAVLRWYQDQPIGESDIDVFCANAKQASDVIERVKSYGRYSTKFESENAVTLSHYAKESGKNWTIQIITRRHFANMKEVLDNFDITVCQVGTCGDEFVLGKHTAKDIREKNLRFNRPLQPDALKRLVKYWVYGYRPVDDTLKDIQNNPNAKWTFELDGDYNNAF